MTLKARIRAVDRFIKGCREDGIYDDLQAACVMAGWSNLAGALTPLKGAAPTNSGFLDADLDRGIGLKGNGSSKYLNSNRANNADGQDDNHNAVYVTQSNSTGTTGFYIDSGDQTSGSNNLGRSGIVENLFVRNRTSTGTTLADVGSATGLIGHARSLSSAYAARVFGADTVVAAASQSPTSTNINLYARPGGSPAGYSNATIAFYSIGSATDLAALDARVSTLMADLRAIEETGFDRDAIAYIRAVEAADGAYLETDVKVAVNNLVSGLKADGLWDAIASSCLLCGPRTLAGALVPLKGDAPTAYGFVAGDHFRDTGLKGDGTSYLDSNRSGVADARNDHHIAFYSTSAGGATYPIGVRYGVAPTYYTIAGYDFYSRSASPGTGVSTVASGTYGLSRANGTSFNWIRASGSVSSAASVSQEVSGNDNHFVFALNAAGSAVGTTSATLAFYSIGSSIDLTKLDSHISDYVTAIGAAI